MKSLLRCGLALALVAQAQATTTVLPQKVIKVLPTKDVALVGWIRGDVIVLPSVLEGVEPEMIARLNATSASCAELVAEWFFGSPTYLGNDASRRYANAFLIKNSANAMPPDTIDYDTFQTAGDYRLFLRFKAAMRVKDGLVLSQEGQTPKYLQSAAIAGRTPDPCGVGPALFSQEHPLNGTKGITTTGTGVFLMGQARVGQAGQTVDTTINETGGTVGNTTPWIWGVLKFDAAGQRVFPFALGGGNASFQIFPTYYLYENGQKVGQIQQGALEPFVQRNSDSQITADIP